MERNSWPPGMAWGSADGYSWEYWQNSLVQLWRVKSFVFSQVALSACLFLHPALNHWAHTVIVLSSAQVIHPMHCASREKIGSDLERKLVKTLSEALPVWLSKARKCSLKF